MIYIVYGPSKTGTTSLFKMLTDNNKFPCIQTHNEMMNIGIHDAKNSIFSEHLHKHFQKYIKSSIEFDKDINYNEMPSISYSLYFEYDYEILAKFLKFLRTFELKMISAYRDPVERSISAFLHWLDKDALKQHLLITFGKDSMDENMELSKLNHRPYELILSKKNLNVEDCLKIYNEIFEESLMYEYICASFNYKVHFGIDLYLKKNENYSIKSSEGCQLFYYKLSEVNMIQESMYKFLDISKDYELPIERNYKNRKNYLIDPEEVKQYLLKH